MFTPEIAKKATHVLNTTVENEFKMLLQDLIDQRTAKTKPDSSDLELRITAVEIGLLIKLKNYRQSLSDTVKYHVISH